MYFVTSETTSKINSLTEKNTNCSLLILI